jgi:hypothetical protein
MPTDADPIVGNWYEIPDKDKKFEVVALDEDNGLVDVQYFDGDLDEIDLDAWYEMELAPTEAPEDWTGPIDGVERDDLGYSEAEPEEAEYVEPAPKSRRTRRISLSDEFDELEQDEDEEAEDEDAWDEGP